MVSTLPREGRICSWARISSASLPRSDSLQLLQDVPEAQGTGVDGIVRPRVGNVTGGVQVLGDLHGHGRREPHLVGLAQHDGGVERGRRVLVLLLPFHSQTLPVAAIGPLAHGVGLRFSSLNGFAWWSPKNSWSLLQAWPKRSSTVQERTR